MDQMSWRAAASIAAVCAMVAFASVQFRSCTVEQYKTDSATRLEQAKIDADKEVREQAALRADLMKAK